MTKDARHTTPAEAATFRRRLNYVSATPNSISLPPGKRVRKFQSGCSEAILYGTPPPRSRTSVLIPQAIPPRPPLCHTAPNERPRQPPQVFVHPHAQPYPEEPSLLSRILHVELRVAVTRLCVLCSRALLLARRVRPAVGAPSRRLALRHRPLHRRRLTNGTFNVGGAPPRDRLRRLMSLAARTTPCPSGAAASPRRGEYRPTITTATASKTRSGRQGSASSACFPYTARPRHPAH